MRAGDRREWPPSDAAPHRIHLRAAALRRRRPELGDAVHLSGSSRLSPCHRASHRQFIRGKSTEENSATTCFTPSPDRRHRSGESCCPPSGSARGEPAGTLASATRAMILAHPPQRLFDVGLRARAGETKRMMAEMRGYITTWLSLLYR